jgi:hypothetical protein
VEPLPAGPHTIVIKNNSTSSCLGPVIDVTYHLTIEQ